MVGPGAGDTGGVDATEGIGGTEGAGGAQEVGGTEGVGGTEEGGIEGAGPVGVAGVKLGALKLKPQASQNWPVLGVPQRGQGSAGAPAGPGQGDGPVAA